MTTGLPALLRLQTFEKPEWNRLLTQPSYWLRKLAEPSALERGDIMAHFWPCASCFQSNGHAQVGGLQTTTVKWRAAYVLIISKEVVEGFPIKLYICCSSTDQWSCMVVRGRLRRCHLVCLYSRPVGGYLTHRRTVFVYVSVCSYGVSLLTRGLARVLQSFQLFV